MSQDWLNSDELSSQKAKINNQNFEDSFYSTKPRVGFTGFFFECIAGKPDDSEHLDTSASAGNDTSITSTILSSTQMLSSAVSSLTTGFSSLFSWKAADPVETKITEMKVFPGEKQITPVSKVSEIPKEVASVTEAVIHVMETTAVTETTEIENVAIITEPIEIPVMAEPIEIPVIAEPVEITVIAEPVETVITSVPNDNTVPVIEQAEITTVEPVEAEQAEMKDITTEAKEEENLIETVESAIIEPTPTESVEIAETVLEPVIETTSTDSNLMQTALNTVIESVLMQVIESKHEENSDNTVAVSELIEIPLIEAENIETPVVIPVASALIESSVSIPESPIQENFIPLSETNDIPMAAFTPLPDELPTIITTTTTNATIESPKMNDISYQEEQLDKKQQETIVDDYVDPNDYWYKSLADDELEFDSDEEEDLFERHLTGSYYAIDSYINFSQDSFISIKPIPKKNQSSKKAGLKVHFEPMVELMDNVVNNDKAAIKKVLQEGQINVNDNDKLGYTMLHYAASHNHADLIKYLIEKEGADVNCVDPSDWTPLHLAAIADNLKACKVLLEHDANLEYPNCDNNLPVDLTEDVKVKKLFADATKKKLSAKKVRALYDWEADSPEYLSLRKSEGLKVLDRRNEFWLVQNEFKQIGLVPRIYIQ